MDFSCLKAAITAEKFFVMTVIISLEPLVGDFALTKCYGSPVPVDQR